LNKLTSWTHKLGESEFRRVIQVLITSVALGFITLHLIYPQLAIDSTVVMLLGIAVIPWLAPLFKSIELPGGLKVEFQELERLEKKAKSAGLLSDIQPTSLPRMKYAFEIVADHDPNLTLAGLRIEIETRLKKVAESKGVSTERISTTRLFEELHKKSVLNLEEVSILKDLLPILNRATHGAEIDSRAYQWCLDVGPRILRSLEDRAGETNIAELMAQWKKRDGAAWAEIGTELSKAFVRSPLSFLRIMKTNESDFVAWLAKMEHHTFTLFEARTDLDGDLYQAYYEKLLQRMKEAASNALESDCKGEAQRVLSALGTIKIRHIW